MESVLFCCQRLFHTKHNRQPQIDLRFATRRHQFFSLQGFGPRFFLFLSLYNDSPKLSETNLLLVVTPTSLYQVTPNFVTLPIVCARSSIQTRIVAEAMHKDGLAGVIQVSAILDL